MMTLDGALDATEYRNIKAKLEPEVQRLLSKEAELNSKEDNADEILEYGLHFLRNFDKLFAVATLEERALILGSTFPEKLIFENGRVRTASPESNISALLNPDKDSSGNKKGSAIIFALPSGQVEVTEVEPCLLSVLKPLEKIKTGCIYSHVIINLNASTFSQVKCNRSNKNQNNLDLLFSRLA